MNRNHYVYKLTPPRPSFAADMSEQEQAVMGDHAAYWASLFEAGTVVVFGVVMEEAGAWGLAVVEAADEDEVRALAADDPAVTSELCTFDIGVMPSPSVRAPRAAA
jgi:uncharacterized protein YciI